MFKCTCGETFASRAERFTHIALANPRWPRVTRDDPHAPAEGRLKASVAIARLSGGPNFTKDQINRISIALRRTGRQ